MVVDEMGTLGAGTTGVDGMGWSHLSTDSFWTVSKNISQNSCNPLMLASTLILDFLCRSFERSWPALRTVSMCKC